jgi:uncharacterized protein YcbX
MQGFRSESGKNIVNPFPGRQRGNPLHRVSEFVVNVVQQRMNTPLRCNIFRACIVSRERQEVEQKHPFVGSSLRRLQQARVEFKVKKPIVSNGVWQRPVEKDGFARIK